MSLLVLGSMILATAAIALSWLLIPRLVEAHARFRGAPFVVCPETGQPVEVEVDALQAALGTITGTAEGPLRLRHCSRWPEKKDCGQECVAQIAASPDACVMASMVRQWYEGAGCFFCGRGLGERSSYDAHMVALNPAGVTLPWNAIAWESLPESLATHRPVCWDCHVVETFLRQHGEECDRRPTHIRRVE